MSDEELKSKVRHLFEDGWNKGDLAVFDEVCIPNLAYHHPTNPQTSSEGVKKYVAAVRASYPDMHFTLHEMFASEGDKVVTRWTWEGTDTGGSVAFGGAPTGKHVAFTGIHIARFEGGRSVEEWAEGDYLSLLKQLKG
jgi:predicted ester cyclase